MAVIKLLDGNGDSQWFEVTGDGTQELPFRIKGANSDAVLTALDAIQAATEALDSATLPTGAATATLQSDSNTSLTAIDGHVDGLEAAIGAAADAAASADTGTFSLIAITKRVVARLTSLIALLPTTLSNGFFQVSVKETITLPASQSGTWTVQPGNTANTTAWMTKVQCSATSTCSNVSAAATTGTVLASNVNRLGATIYNDSTALLYLKLGATASSTSYTVQMEAGSYYEIPFGYTGVIDGIWASATGSARVTELS